MTTPTHLDTDQPEWAGAGGLAVHGVTALLVVCRLLPHVCTRRPRGEARRDDGGGDDDLEGSGCPRPAVAPLNKRKAFHIVLFLAVACDTPHVWMCRGTVDVPAEAWVYSFHLLSYSLFFVAYSLVVMTWARVFAVGERRTSVAWGVSVGNALYAICSAYAIVRLWSAPSVAVFVNGEAACALRAPQGTPASEANPARGVCRQAAAGGVLRRDNAGHHLARRLRDVCPEASPRTLRMGKDGSET